MFEWPATSTSSMQNWEHLDFKTPEVERREENEKPCTVYQQQQSCLWDVVRITLPTHSLCRVKSCHLRSSLSIPTTQKLPLQAARQELVLKLLNSKPDTHIWKQLLHSQGITDESQAQRRRFCSLYCFSGTERCNLIFVQQCL